MRGRQCIFEPPAKCTLRQQLAGCGRHMWCNSSAAEQRSDVPGSMLLAPAHVCLALQFTASCVRASTLCKGSQLDNSTFTQHVPVSSLP